MNKAASLVLVLVLALAAVQDIDAASLTNNPQQYTWELMLRVTAFEQRLLYRLEALMKEDARAAGVLQGYSDSIAKIEEPVKTCAAQKIKTLEMLVNASQSVMTACRSPIGSLISDASLMRNELYAAIGSKLSQAVVACLATQPKNATELATQNKCIATAYTDFAKLVEPALNKVIQLDREFGRMDSTARGCVWMALSLSDAPYKNYIMAVNVCKNTASG